MIIDSSAVLAILRDEKAADQLRQALAETPRTDRLISAASYLVSGIAVDRALSPLLGREFDRLVTSEDIRIIEVTEAQARIARAAHRDFGRGSGHQARLNFGDCFSYALAIERNQPLLYIGEDFRHTDVRDAVERA